MSAADELGRSGPHPELVDAVIADLQASDAFTPEWRATLSRGHIELLDQRTLFDLPIAHRPDLEERVSLSSWFGVLQGRRPIAAHLVLAQAVRRQGSDEWNIAGHTIRPLGEPPLQPFVGVILAVPLALDIGLFVTDPDIAKVRVELADGTVVEDGRAGPGLHLCVPLRRPAAWARRALVRLLDADEREIMSEAVQVGPARRAAIS